MDMSITADQIMVKVDELSQAQSAKADEIVLLQEVAEWGVEKDANLDLILPLIMVALRLDPKTVLARGVKHKLRLTLEQV